MPTYEYECKLCGVFEVEQRISEAPLKCKPGCSEKKCPKSAQRLISASNFVLKGGGWYKSDYSSGSTSSSSSSSTKKKGSESLKQTSSPSCGTGCGCHSGKGTKGGTESK